jgi:DNA-damage-inducible protein D
MSETPESNAPMPLEVFHFDEGKTSFEDMCQSNGIRYWWASELAELLGYESIDSFRKCLNRAMAACAQLQIPIHETFISVAHKLPSGKTIEDFKLTRFGCYLTTLNCDPKKERVAKAQAYFITMAEAFEHYIRESDAVERVTVRGEVTDGEKSLSSTAYRAGLENWGFFHSAGYRGMYNMDFSQLKALKKVPAKRTPLDFMGKQELAANLFRITQTEAKIKNENISGQRKLEATAHAVGKTVRETMINLSGTRPEQLPPAEDIQSVRKTLKSTNRNFEKLDKLKQAKQISDKPSQS